MTLRGLDADFRRRPHRSGRSTRTTRWCGRARLNVEQLQRTADQDTRTAYANFNASVAQVVVLREAATLAAKNFEAQVDDYRRGVVSNLDVLTALQDYQTARIQLHNANMQARLDLINLHVAAGMAATRPGREQPGAADDVSGDRALSHERAPASIAQAVRRAPGLRHRVAGRSLDPPSGLRVDADGRADHLRRDRPFAARRQRAARRRFSRADHQRHLERLRARGDGNGDRRQDRGAGDLHAGRAQRHLANPAGPGLDHARVRDRPQHRRRADRGAIEAQQRRAAARRRPADHRQEQSRRTSRSCCSAPPPPRATCTR